MKTRLLLACMLLCTFSLALYAQDADSVDVALIIDRSQSMEGDKLSAAKNGADQLIQRLEVGDEVTVIGYSNHGHVYYPMTYINSSAQITAACAAVNGMDIGEYTSIGDGIYKALLQCNNLQRVNPIVGFVLLSDGYENVTPVWSQVRGSVPGLVNIYTVGLGTDIAALMSQIASYTGGAYYNSNTSNLYTIVQQILDNILCDGNRLLEYCDTFESPSTVTVPVVVDPSMQDVSFYLIWQHDTADLRLRLVAPDGTVYDAGHTFSSTVDHADYSTQEFFRFQTSAMPGTWTAMIDCKHIGGESEPYTFAVSGNADLKMSFSFDEGTYAPGDYVGLLVDLTDRGQKITGAEVNAVVEYSDGNSFVVPLTESPFELTGPGMYSARFESAPFEEAYTVHITASGATANGPFTRMTMCSVWVGEQEDATAQMPITTSLSAVNYPNPFNPVTTISYSLPQQGTVQLDIYNVRGQRVRSLVNGTMPAGAQQAVWNGTDDHGAPVASGCYLYRLQSCGQTVSGRMLLLK